MNTFQFLIGNVITGKYHIQTSRHIMFQFLIGNVITATTESFDNRFDRFNSS